MSALNPEHLKAVIEMINEGPFFRHMSMRVTELGVGYSQVVAEIGRKHMNPFGALHGGVYSSVIDTAAYWSAYCDLPEEQGLVSIDIKVDFLAPVIDQIVLRKFWTGFLFASGVGLATYYNGVAFSVGSTLSQEDYKETGDGDVIDV